MKILVAGVLVDFAKEYTNRLASDLELEVTISAHSGVPTNIPQDIDLLIYVYSGEEATPETIKNMGNSRFFHVNEFTEGTIRVALSRQLRKTYKQVSEA